MRFLTKLFRREPEFDLEKEVGKMLLNLPTCSARVAIASPAYDPEHYRCDVTMDPHELASWAKRHAEGVVGFGPEQAARQALPIWLRGADMSDMRTTYVPGFASLIRPYIADFMEDANVRVYCTECSADVDDVVTQKVDQKTHGHWSWWTDVWTCPKGHEFHREEHELHLHI